MGMRPDSGENVTLGSNAEIGEYVILGVPLAEAGGARLVIGDNAIIRSHSVIYGGNTIGHNFRTGHGVLVRENNRIGDDVSIGTHSIVERENVICSKVRIHSHCFIPEFVVIERGVWIGPSVTVLNVLHPPCPRFTDCAKSVHIKENAKIGGNVTIGPRVTVGRNSLVGMGSVVTTDIPDDVLAYGNPARVIKSLKDVGCELGFYETAYEWEKGR